ncbi:TonB-dependent receptor [Arenibacter sp. F26102]|uniref:SusC/RagA family TonB-linked outer membrane protein n=1 Tax=Arenibacter sp. F26102 TaxID=2926416 RepID=UPI001FF2C096|nr:TonB-dependent receptor [Arenibacter sp. F26102]MCK0148248.1 TonB-dependent receptor [Arenibacter sp. F26102]
MLVTFSILAINYQLKASENDVDLSQLTVTGSVTDATGTPLPGASIVEKGTANGTQSDFDGNFAIEASGNATLLISYIGFMPQEVAIGGRSTIDIVLEEDASQLEEVVLVGYGTQSRASITNAISSVSSEDLVETPAIGVQQALQGRAAGVQVVNTGTPGSDPLVTIRGLGTFGNNSPLYVVDGVPTGSLNNIPAESIESVDVLKDASSAAIYGSRGSNGVILIKTKAGRPSVKPVFQFSTYAGLATNPKTLDLLNADQYRQYASEAYDADPVAPGNQVYPGLQPGNFDPAVNTDWQDEVFRTGVVQNYNVQASGGSETATYSVNAGYLKQEGTLIETDFQRYSLGLNTNIKLSDKIKVGQTFNLGVSRRHPGEAIFSSLLRITPTIPVYDESTNFYSEVTTSFDGQDANNPVRLLRNNDNLDTSTSIVGSLFGSYEIVEDLTYTLTIGLDHSFNNTDNFSRSILTGSRQRLNAETEKVRRKSMGTVITNTLNYNTSINNLHNIDVLAGYERNKGNYEQVDAMTRNSLTDFVENLNPGDIINVSSFTSENNLHSLFGRASYDFDKKLLLSGTIRADGSSRFGPENRWGYFPSVSGGVNLGKIFFEDNTSISDLKLRGSWGITGNNNIGDYLYDFGLQTNFNYVFDGNLVSGTRPSRLANPALKWEELTSINIGADLGLFNNAFTFSAEYFINQSDGLLVDVPTPRSSGDTRGTITQNVGGTESKGLEFVMAFKDYEGDFTWGANFNAFANLSSEVTSLGNVEAIFNGSFYQQNHNRLLVGESMFHFFGYRTDGIFQNQAEVDAYATQNNAEPGNIRYVDVNNNGVVNADDRVIIGNPIPDVTLGLDLNFAYKNLDASIFLNGVYGNDTYAGYRYTTEQQARLFNMSTVVMDRWSPTNPSNTIPKATPGFTGNELVSDRFIEDGSFTRLRSITLGYTIPETALQGFSDGALSSLRFYLSGQNIATWTKYSGYDPEIVPGQSGGTVTAIGLDLGNYAPPRTILAGLQVKF